MKKTDDALIISNPRLLCAIYFGIISFAYMIIALNILIAQGLVLRIPFAHALVLCGCINALFGALFGEKILLHPRPCALATCFWAYLMILLATPFCTIGVLFSLEINQAPSILGLNAQGLVNFYLSLLVHHYVLGGFGLGFLAGFAALYLRGSLVYNLINSTNSRRQLP